MQPRVRLWNSEGVLLIILRVSGIIYTNQTGGTSCCQPEAEGVLVPLNNDYPVDHPESVERRLRYYLEEAHWLTSGLADDVDAILASSADTSFVKVDRTRLEDSMEAWVYVDVVDDPSESGFPLISGFGRCKGIITWFNSD